jgi:hypothetical protein
MEVVPDPRGARIHLQAPSVTASRLNNSSTNELEDRRINQSCALPSKFHFVPKSASIYGWSNKIEGLNPEAIRLVHCTMTIDSTFLGVIIKSEPSPRENIRHSRLFRLLCGNLES